MRVSGLGLFLPGRHGVGRALFVSLCALVFVFLMAPILAIAPLSFNVEPYFTYPMPGVSTRWYEAFFASANWRRATANSLAIALATTALSTLLGTLAALGLARGDLPYRGAILAFLISPMVLPIVVTGVGLYFFYAGLGLQGTYLGMVLAHTTIATPFVVVTVSAALAGYDWTLTRAAASLGARPATAFVRVTMPIILPSMLSGALFAFIASFDDLVIALFLAGTEQRTLPKQMWSGVRENLDPTIIAVATMLSALSVLAVGAGEALRRRGEWLRGKP